MIEFLCFGNVVEKPELKETQTGLKYCNIVLKVNRPYANADGIIEADDYSVTCWKQLAEDMVSELDQNKAVLVKGRIQANNYKKDDGCSFRTDLIASSINIVA